MSVVCVRYTDLLDSVSGIDLMCNLVPLQLMAVYIL